MGKTKGRVIGPADFSEYMKALLEEYGDDVFSATVEAEEKVSKEAVSRLKSAGGFKNKLGRYRKGWRAELRKTRTSVLVTIFNKTDYQLTHLLEFGHVLPQGGRAQAYPHIADVNDWAMEALELEIAEAIERRANK